MKNIFFLLLFLGFSNFLKAQHPNYVMPSPQAATFLKHRDYPVNFSTGLVDITIPLFSLDLKGYQLPIEARYHASGRKVDMSYSELGMNWKLEAYGIITREIRGMSDFYQGQIINSDLMEKPGDYFNTLSTDQLGDRRDKYERRLRLTGEHPNSWIADNTEYDIYTISFKGISSSFIIKNGDVHFLDYSPFKVEFTGGIFQVTDDFGIQHSFGNMVESGINYGATLNYQNGQGPMSWYLGKIYTPSQDIIRFKYSYANSNTIYLGGNLTYGATARLADYITTYGYPIDLTEYEIMNSSGLFSLNISNNAHNEEYGIAYLTDIVSASGNLKFQYNTTRFSLESITVQSVGMEVLKRINIHYKNTVTDKFTIPNNQGISIQEIEFSDVESEQNHKYTFDYYEGVISAQHLSEYGYGRDYWGYANTNTHFNIIPINQITEVGSNHYQRNLGNESRRAPSYQSKLIGMLKKINYPTGGYSEFIYEPNKYIDFGNDIKEGPGLRISSVKSFDGASFINKVYKYGNNENGAGSLLWKPSARDFQMSQIVTHVSGVNGTNYDAHNNGRVTNAIRYRYREFYSDPVGFIRGAYNLPIYYSQVNEYQYDDVSRPLGKTEHNFSIPNFETDIKYFYDSGTNDSYEISKFVPHLYSSANLTSKRVYEFSSNQYNEIKNTSYFYKKLKEITIPQVTYFRRHKVITLLPPSPFNYDEYFIETVSPSNPHGTLPIPWDVIGIRDYFLTAASVQLDSIVETDLRENFPVRTSTNFLYESSYTSRPSSIVAVNSEGIQTTTKMYFPDDVINAQSLEGDVLDNASLQGIIALNKINKHLVSQPIQTEKYIGDHLVTLERSVFKLFGGIPYLSLVSDKHDTNATLTKIYEINQYDNYGNPLQVIQKEGLYTVYIWGYSGQYPVAKIENTTYAEVVAILGETTINNLNSSHLSDATIINMMDMLRNHPDMQKAHVTHYTYKPLIGMTSMTDPKGVTEYYEYDGFGRLSVVKDFEGNIVKTYCYNYAGQQIDCFPAPLIYENVTMSQVFQRNDCPSGQNGSEVTYIVPAGKYTSMISQEDANGQAQDDIDLYGQGFANQHGSCTPATTTLILYNDTDHDVVGASVSLWQGPVHIGTYSFPEDEGGTTVYPHVPAGTYRIDTHITMANPNQYTFRLPTQSVAGNSSFGEINLAAGGGLPIQLEFN